MQSTNNIVFLCALAAGLLFISAQPVFADETITEATAAYNVGAKYYVNGREGKPNNEYMVMAVGWFRKAAKLGSSAAQARLGEAYETGNGITRNYAEALKWYRLSVTAEDKDAECGLGRLYATGHGVKRDDRAAAKWYKRAADQGLTSAQYELGKLYMSGHGVEKDYAAAYFLLALSARDIDSSMELRDEAAKHLTQEQLNTLQSHLALWKPISPGEIAEPMSFWASSWR